MLNVSFPTGFLKQDVQVKDASRRPELMWLITDSGADLDNIGTLPLSSRQLLAFIFLDMSLSSLGQLRLARYEPGAGPFQFRGAICATPCVQQSSSLSSKLKLRPFYLGHFVFKYFLPHSSPFPVGYLSLSPSSFLSFSLSFPLLALLFSLGH